jgi:hypothetical protein
MTTRKKTLSVLEKKYGSELAKLLISAEKKRRKKFGQYSDVVCLGAGLLGVDLRNAEL